MKVLLSIASIMSLTAPTLPVPTSNIETVINNDIKPLGEEIIISNKEELLHNVSTIAGASVNNNIYFGTYHGAYVIDQKTNKAKLLCKDALNVNEYRHIRVVAIDSNKNIYFGTFSNGAYVLKVGATTATKIEGVSSVVRSIAITSNDDVYFGTKNNTYILKANEATVNKFSSLTDLFSICNIPQMFSTIKKNIKKGEINLLILVIFEMVIYFVMLNDSVGSCNSNNIDLRNVVVRFDLVFYP